MNGPRNKVEEAEIERSKGFKNANGALLSKRLIFELCDIEFNQAIYTLRDYDFIDSNNGHELKSLKNRYLEIADPTEYRFGTKYFYSWAHFQKMLKNKKFLAHINAWREELDLMLKSKGIEMQTKLAEEGNAQAAKWLAEKGYKVEAAYKGRPTKKQEDMNKAVKKQTMDEFDEDAENIGLKIVNGGG